MSRSAVPAAVNVAPVDDAAMRSPVAKRLGIGRLMIFVSPMASAIGGSASVPELAVLSNTHAHRAAAFTFVSASW